MLLAQPHIFQRFYQGRAAPGQGRGLGLSIAQEIAAIHSGTISFVSREGEGSLFTLSLPLFNEEMSRSSL